jgi:hypothetical protein
MRKRASWFSLAVAVTTRCDGSVAVYSVEAVKEAGRANRRSTRVAVAMNAGTAVVFSARVLDALDTVDGAICQSALERDPPSASKRDPFDRRALLVALAPSELVGVAETVRARVV